MSTQILIKNNGLKVKSFYCDNCNKFMRQIMIKDELWIQIAQEAKHLCLSCIELRLNRLLTLYDCPLTDEMLLGIILAMQTPDFNFNLLKGFKVQH